MVGSSVGGAFPCSNDKFAGRTSAPRPDLPCRESRLREKTVVLRYILGTTLITATVFRADGEQTDRAEVQRHPPLDGRSISRGEYRFEAAGQNLVLVANEHTRGRVIADAVQYLPV
jgi:hypothetical protein